MSTAAHGAQQPPGGGSRAASGRNFAASASGRPRSGGGASSSGRRPGGGLTYFLRHSPPCAMDASGWVRVADLLPHLSGISEGDLREIVRKDKKGRYELDAANGRIRACQGHTVKLDAPVLTRVESPEHLARLLAELDEARSNAAGGGVAAAAGGANGRCFAAHCTTEAAWALIQRDGFLRRMQRTHVHFATRGYLSRHNRDVTIALVLDIPRALAEGHQLFLSTNGVLLSAEDVPVHLVSAEQRANVPELSG